MEAIKIMKAMKIHITPSIDQEEVQREFIRLGYTWGAINKNLTFKIAPIVFLYTSKDGYITYSTDIHFFINHKNEEVTLQDLKNMQS